MDLSFSSTSSLKCKVDKIIKAVFGFGTWDKSVSIFRKPNKLFYALWRWFGRNSYGIFFLFFHVRQFVWFQVFKVFLIRLHVSHIFWCPLRFPLFRCSKCLSPLLNDIGIMKTHSCCFWPELFHRLSCFAHPEDKSYDLMLIPMWMET